MTDYIELAQQDAKTIDAMVLDLFKAGLLGPYAYAYLTGPLAKLTATLELAADPPTQRCPFATKEKDTITGQCSRPVGHAGGHS